MLHNLGCVPTVASPHQYCAILHTPGNLETSLLLEGVDEGGPGAGCGYELLAAVHTWVSLTTTGKEAVLGVVLPPHHQPGQLAGGGGGGDEHLRGGVSRASGYEDGCISI